MVADWQVYIHQAQKWGTEKTIPRYHCRNKASPLVKAKCIDRNERAKVRMLGQSAQRVLNNLTHQVQMGRSWANFLT